jgi:uncharacterized membrane protein YcaP (DUF421 family)
MDSIIRGAVTYGFIWLVFRVSGKRTLAQITTFDALLLLIISETVQAALVSSDNSMTNSFLLILSMLGIDIVLSCIKQKYPFVERIVDGLPVVLLDRQGMHHQRMEKERVDQADILAAARELQGLANLDQVEYAVLEQSGGITVVPKPS